MNASRKPRSGFIEGGQMAIFWRILHLLISRYGNNPMGQTLVVLTMVYLNDRGMPPTMTQLCAATGLPKGSVSRYVAGQIERGLVKETVDPKDGRRRLLVQTKKGRAKWNWHVKQIDQMFRQVEAQVNQFDGEADPRSGEVLLGRMTQHTRNASQRKR